MIAHLAGILVHKSPDALIVDVHGVGYQVFVSLNAFYALPPQGEAVQLHVQTQMRENALELFGFLDSLEKTLFGCLLTVSGIGPRTALNILSGLPSADLMAALAAGDTARLVAVPGVGRKTAERLIVELKDRVQKLRGQSAEDVRSPDRVQMEAASALVNLGYKPNEAERVVRDVVGRGTSDVAAVIRQALQRLSA